MIHTFRWTITLRNEQGAARPWAEELLRLGFPLEWPVGSGDVFAVGHAGPLENQSATLADVVLGELCSGWRGRRRHSAVLAVESLRRTPVGAGCPSHGSRGLQHLLRPLVIPCCSAWVPKPFPLRLPPRCGLALGESLRWRVGRRFTNQVDFSWANTQIDPNTIVFRVIPRVEPAGEAGKPKSRPRPRPSRWT